MADFYYSLAAVDSFTIYVLLGLVGCIAWFIREVVGSSMLAAISVPFLVLCGVVSQKLFQMFMITAANDKDANVVLSTGAGVLVGLVIVILSVYGIARYREARAKARRVLPATISSAKSR